MSNSVQQYLDQDAIKEEDIIDIVKEEIEDDPLAFGSDEDPLSIEIVILSLISSGSSLPQAISGNPSESVLVPVRSYHSTGSTNQFHQEDSGAVRFGFAHAGQVKSEFKDPTGNVYGYYSYTNPSQKPTIVLYKAGPNGFEVSSNKLPEKVQDTPAVVAARENFLKIYNRVAKRKQEKERALLESQGTQNEETPVIVQE